VSEHALTMLLALARHVVPHDRMTRAGRGWQDRLRADTAIVDVEGQTLGIVGLGEIGGEMARKCLAAFNMRVVAYDPYVDAGDGAAHRRHPATEPRCGPRAVRLRLDPRRAQTARRAACSAPLPSRACAPHACLINTARGKIVQQAALAEALAKRRIRAAALDVFEDEPVGPGNPLAALDNIILSPHVGGLSESFLKGGALSAARHILEALRWHPPGEPRQPPRRGDRAMQRAARVGMMSEG